MLQGPVFTVYAGFNKDYSIDPPSLCRYVEAMADGGAENFYWMPFNGRFAQLTNHEVLSLTEHAIRTSKEVDSGSMIVSAPINGSIDHTISFGSEVKRRGAEILSVLMTERFYCVDQIGSFYRELSSIGLPIVAHVMPLISGYNGRSMDWPLQAYEAIASMNHVVAIKEDHKQVAHIDKVVANYGEELGVIVAARKSLLLQVQGFENLGYLNGLSMIDPAIAFAFWRRVQSDTAAAQSFVEEVDDPFWDGIVMRFGWHRVNRALLEAAGHLSRREREPMPSLANEDFAQVEMELARVRKALVKWI